MTKPQDPMATGGQDSQDPQVPMVPGAQDPQIPFQPGLSRRAVQRGTYQAPAPVSRWSPDHPGQSISGQTPSVGEPRQVPSTVWAESVYVLEDVRVPPGPPVPAGLPASPEPPAPPEQPAHPRQQATPQATPGPVPGAGGYRAYVAATSPSVPEKKPQDRSRRGPGWLALFVSMVLAVVLGAGVALTVVGVGDSNNKVAGPELSTGQSASAQESNSQEVVPPVTEGVVAPDWQAVANAVRPATVSIMVEGTNASATGSGVVYDSQARVITNHHVVEPALTSGNITVTTHDGRIYEAVVVGTDQTTDLAVLQLQGEPDLPAARFATSEVLEVGQPVMAVGSPLGLADTVTTGIISALDRPVTVEASGGVDPANPQAGAQTELVVTNAIQIDASINPGNSGGPLFDSSGGVIGINSSIASNSSSADTAGSIGLGFAIPVDLVKSVADQIISTGSVQHALLGVEIKSGVVVRGSSTQLGAEIATVMDGGAAAQAGLQPGDVIVGIDGHSVTSGPALTGFVRRYTAGNSVTLDVVRDGTDMQVTAELQAR